ncbi:MAG TPA: tetratricopeptide repeat protein [Actinomycetota bacterium]|nr:tetratricopeptide repeat protein [Actinomycetota bacterium]
MSTQAFVIDVDEQDFEREVVERSHSVPVVIDFWADWCGPCKALSPVLERLAAEAQGGWVLAKVDVDSNPRLAQAFGVQGIPAVKAVKGGRLVAEFTGALPEPQVREWLTVLGPTPAELALERARRLEDQGDSGAALEAYREVLREEPGNQEAAQAVARLELAERASAGYGSEEDLRRRLEANPADVEAAGALADLAAARGDLDTAFSLLLKALSMTAGEDRENARTRLLSLLETVEPDDPRALTARKRLAQLLF